MTSHKKTGTEEWLDSLDAATVSAHDGTRLRKIGMALTALEQAEIDLELAVENARAAGDSWQAIGLVLGTSRQAAHRKFAKTAASSVRSVRNPSEHS